MTIGHIHLRVSDLEQSIAFYQQALGLELTQRIGSSAAFLSWEGYHHHLGLNTWHSKGAGPDTGNGVGLYHVAFLVPSHFELARILKQLTDLGIPLTGAADHGVSEAIYLQDPDGNGIEIYCDRPQNLWPRNSDGALAMTTEPLDLEMLLRLASR